MGTSSSCNRRGCSGMQGSFEVMGAKDAIVVFFSSADCAVDTFQAEDFQLKPLSQCRCRGPWN